MKVKIGDYEYPVIIVRKRIKNMYLRTSANNEILITCNNRFSLKDIVSFIDSKADWIINSIEKQQRKTGNCPFETYIFIKYSVNNSKQKQSSN